MLPCSFVEISSPANLLMSQVCPSINSALRHQLVGAGSTRNAKRMVDHLTVLQSSREPRSTTNPYIVMLQRALSDHPATDLLLFGWRRALFGSYDVFHVHWPEILVNGNGPLKKIVRQLLTAALIVRLWIGRIPIVRTVHNVELPVGLSKPELFLLKAIDRQTALRIRLNVETWIPNDAPYVTIPHGHYRDWFARYKPSHVNAGQIGFFGLIRRYKGVESLIEAFRDTAGSLDQLSLAIGGKASTGALGDVLRLLSNDDSRIHLTLKFLSDQELVDIATSSELLVLPYRFMHNSGSALTALSLNRPILVPDNEVNRSLSEEVGEGWVWRFTGELDGAIILDVLAKVRARPTGTRPNLESRGWTRVGDRHFEAYSRAIAITRSAPLLRRSQ